MQPSREQLGKTSRKVVIPQSDFFFFKASNVATPTEKAGRCGAPPDEPSAGSSC